MTTPIWLVRHGEASASWGEHPDPGLSSLGHQQAETSALSLVASIPKNAQLISSPKQRAQETAQPLAERFQCPVAIDPVFDELVSPVALADRPRWLTTFMGQTWHEQSAEVLSWRDGIIKRLEAVQTPSIIFCHFMVINAVVAAVRDHSATVQFWPDNGSIHEFVVHKQGLQLVSLGQEMPTRIN